MSVLASISRELSVLSEMTSSLTEALFVVVMVDFGCDAVLDVPGRECADSSPIYSTNMMLRAAEVRIKYIRLRALPIGICPQFGSVCIH